MCMMGLDLYYGTEGIIQTAKHFIVHITYVGEPRL